MYGEPECYTASIGLYLRSRDFVTLLSRLSEGPF